MNRWAYSLSAFIAFTCLPMSSWAVCEAESQDHMQKARFAMGNSTPSYIEEVLAGMRRLEKEFVDNVASSSSSTDWVKAMQVTEADIEKVRQYRRGQIAASSTQEHEAQKERMIAERKFRLCIYGNALAKAQGKNNSSATASRDSTRSDSQQQSNQQQAAQAQQQAAQAQQRANENQANADQARQGKRRRHEPENEAHECIEPNFTGLYGGMKNKCSYKVWFTMCGYHPNENSWLRGMACEKQSFGSDVVGPGREVASHTKGVERLYWFACKDPAWPLDHVFVEGQGIQGRCHTVGGN